MAVVLPVDEALLSVHLNSNLAVNDMRVLWLLACGSTWQRLASYNGCHKRAGFRCLTAFAVHPPAYFSTGVVVCAAVLPVERVAG